MLDIGKSAIKALTLLEEGGFKGYAVGGCIRDLLCMETPKDIDLTTSATPIQIVNTFHAAGWITVPIGAKYGTIGVMEQTVGPPIEITTFRKEIGYTDHRHPDVVFSDDLSDDLDRRDLTINSMAMGLNGVLIDPHNGLQDLQTSTLRGINPEERFKEDPLRMMRLFRFLAKYAHIGANIEQNTLEALWENGEWIKKIDQGNVFREMTKILRYGQCGVCAIYTMEQVGFLYHILPELSQHAMVSEETGYHRDSFSLFMHTLRVLFYMGSHKNLDDVVLWAALLHDIAKVRTLTYSSNGDSSNGDSSNGDSSNGDSSNGDSSNGVAHHYGHEYLGAEMAASILARLKAPKVFTWDVVYIVKNHMQIHQSVHHPKLRCSVAMRKLARKIIHRHHGHTTALLQISMGDISDNGYVGFYNYLKLAQAIRDQREVSQAFPFVRGEDLMALGFEGPAIGYTLKKVFERQVVEELDRDRCLKYARSFQRKIRT